MTEWKLFEGSVPYVSTAEFHADRERAPHLEQKFHRGRLERAAEFAAAAYVEKANQGRKQITLSDLGCGDGGFLQLLRRTIPDRDTQNVGFQAWGYDFAPANAAGWTERDVVAYALDVFGADVQRVILGEIVVMTEVLEHLEDPHGVLRWARQADRLICSSPWNETPNSHSPEHAWAWDLDGYTKMIENAGWTIDRHETVDLFQVVLAH